MVDLLRNDLTFGALQKALDGLTLRQQAITNNIANVDTPNYKSTEVNFESDLQAALGHSAAEKDALPLAATDARHLSSTNGPASLETLSPRISQLMTTSLRNDGNNVDVDREMTRLAETQLHFEAATQLINVKFNQLKQAIWEGKR